MQKSLKRNYVLNVTYQLLTLIIPLVTIPYLSRVLQSETVGVLSYSESIVSYFSLFAVLGSTIYAQREIGKLQDNKEEKSKAFWEIQIIRTISGLIAVAAYIVYVFIIKTNFTVCIILALEIFVVIVDINWFFQGSEEFGKTVICGSCSKVLNLIAIFVFVKSPSDLWIYALSKCGFAVLMNMFMWILLPKYIIKVSGIKPFKHLKVILSFFIPTIASQVYTVLDKSMIGWFTATREENGYYEYAEKIVRVSITVITALASVLIPRISKAYADGDDASVKYITYRAIRFVWLMAIPIMFGFIVISDVLVPVYLGDGFAKSIILMRIFSPLVLFVGMANIIGLAFLMPIDKQNVYLVSVIVAAVINLGLNLVLIPKLYSVGAAISSIAAEFVGITLQIAYILKKRLLDAKHIFLPSIKYWIAGGIMAGVVFAIKRVLPITAWALIVSVAVGIVAYFLLLLILRDKMLTEYLNKGWNKIKRIFSKSAETEDAAVAANEEQTQNSDIDLSETKSDN